MLNKTIKEDDDDAVSSSDEEGDENADIYVPGDQLESGQTLEVPAFNSSVLKPERKQFFFIGYVSGKYNHHFLCPP